MQNALLLLVVHHQLNCQILLLLLVVRQQLDWQAVVELLEILL